MLDVRTVLLLSIFANLGYEFNMVQMMVPGLGILFYLLGVVLGKAKRNWFVGIKTPWTLSSDKVWDKTHVLGGKLFKIAGVIAFAGMVLPDYAIWFAVVPILIFSQFILFDASMHIVVAMFVLYVLWYFIDQNVNWRVTKSNTCIDDILIHFQFLNIVIARFSAFLI